MAMPTNERDAPAFRSRLSRRLLLRGTATALVVARAMPPGALGAVASAGPATWRTWILDAADELRPAPPPAPTADEFDELRRLQAERTAEVARTVEAWASGAAVLPWTALALDLIAIHRPNPV